MYKPILFIAFPVPVSSYFEPLFAGKERYRGRSGFARHTRFYFDIAVKLSLFIKSWRGGSVDEALRYTLD